MQVKKCIRTLKKKIKKDLRATFVVTYNTTKLSYDARTKDRVANLCTFLHCIQVLLSWVF